MQTGASDMNVVVLYKILDFVINVYDCMQYLFILKVCLDLRVLLYTLTIVDQWLQTQNHVKLYSSKSSLCIEPNSLAGLNVSFMLALINWLLMCVCEKVLLCMKGDWERVLSASFFNSTYNPLAPNPCNTTDW